MQIHVHSTDNNLFTKYSSGSVTIKGTNYNKNILVTNQEVSNFAAIDIKNMTLADLTLALDFKPDLIIFGSGDKIIYPNLVLIKELHTRGIGVEVMPIQALCRTFNFLVSEERKIAAILFF